MVTVWVLIADPSYLSQLHMRSRALIRMFLERNCIWVVAWLTWPRSTLLREILTCQQKHLLMKATDDWDLRLRLLARL